MSVGHDDFPTGTSMGARPVSVGFPTGTVSACPFPSDMTISVAQFFFWCSGSSIVALFVGATMPRPTVVVDVVAAVVFVVFEPVVFVVFADRPSSC